MCAELAAIHCQDVREFLVAGEAEKIDVGDLDTGGRPLFAGASTTDAVVVIPDANPLNPGSVQVLLNQGTSGMGAWLGLVINAPVSVGRVPSDLEVAFLDNDGHLDVAVTNAGDNTVSILINQGTGDAALVEASTIAVGNAPSAVGAGTFTADAFVDLLVANAGDNNVVLLTNDGNGGFSMGVGIPVGTEPRALVIDDLDDNKDLDAAGVSRLGPGGLTGGVWVLMGLGDGTFDPPVFYDIGAEPRDLAIGDLDQDGFPDIVAVNESDATVSILINQGDGTFVAAPDEPVGGLPRAIEALDLDGDLDLDLVVVADDEVLGPAVQILENTGTIPGVVAFADPVGFGVGADPNDAAGVDLDNDGQVDLGTANTDDGPTGGSVTAVLNAIVPCPSDANGDGSTNVLDLIDVLLCFGLRALPPCDTGQDVNQDGVINVLDLIELLLAFGQECP